MKVKCPRCRKETVLEGNPFRPFCSERCKLVDLGYWLSGSYGIAGTEDDHPEPETKPERETGDS